VPRTARAALWTPCIVFDTPPGSSDVDLICAFQKRPLELESKLLIVIKGIIGVYNYLLIAKHTMESVHQVSFRYDRVCGLRSSKIHV
jgi:hypothetical protein